jgi:hypothetical protein
MLTRIAMLVICATIVFAGVGAAHAQDVVHKYLNDTSVLVKTTTDPAHKRAVLERRLDGLIGGLGSVAGSPLVSERDAASLERVHGVLQDKSDELAGRNGFERVPDDQLDAFTDYIVQDMEQARETITMSLVVFLLIIIIVILIA